MPARTLIDKKFDVIGILPLQDAVLFPNTVIPLAVVKKPGIALVEEALRDGRQIGLVALKEKDVDDPEPDDLRRIGTIGTIQRMIKVPDGTIRCIVGGTSVFHIEQFTQTEPFMAATVIELPDETRETDEVVAMHRNLAGLFSKLIGFLPQAPREMEMEVNNITDSNLLTYFVASSRKSRKPPIASSTGSPKFRPRRPSIRSSARTSIGSCRCPGTKRRRTQSTSRKRAKSSTKIITTSRKSRTGSSSI
jgi:ATP-dependent Lon protease